MKTLLLRRKLKGVPLEIRLLKPRRKCVIINKNSGRGTPRSQTKRYGPKRAYEALYNNLLRRASDRSIPREVEITYEEFLEFIKVENCHYCNIKIIWALPYGGRDSTGAKNRRTNLDRKDNDLGYTKENCVVCCIDCNRTKLHSISYEEMVVIGRMRAWQRLRILDH